MQFLRTSLDEPWGWPRAHVPKLPWLRTTMDWVRRQVALASSEGRVFRWLRPSGARRGTPMSACGEPLHCDYTQYKLFSFCELAWYERFVKGVVREPFAPGPAGKDDPLTLGALVHDGLQSYREQGLPAVSPDRVGALGASAECAAWARL